MGSRGAASIGALSQAEAEAGLATLCSATRETRAGSTEIHRCLLDHTY